MTSNLLYKSCLFYNIGKYKMFLSSPSDLNQIHLTGATEQYFSVQLYLYLIHLVKTEARYWFKDKRTWL